MNGTKEVRFDIWCKMCKHWEKSEAEDPCYDCLNQGWNYESHKPIKYEEDETKAAKLSSHPKQTV